MLLFELQSYNIFSILIVEFRLLISMILYTNMLERNKSKKIRIIYDIRNNPTRQFFQRFDSLSSPSRPDDGYEGWCVRWEKDAVLKMAAVAAW